MIVRPALVVAALSVASLLGVPVVRSAEQALTPLLRPGDALVRACLPSPDGIDRVTRTADVAEARAVWDAWTAALRGGARPADARRELALAPVVEVRAAAQELVVRVPEDGVEVDTPVTHHGVLLGFLRPWRRDGTRVESGGLARVALLGNPSARPVAAEWAVDEQASPVQFLLTSGKDGPSIAHASESRHPQPGQLAWTRDVSLLGDTLPPGLIVGRIVPEEGEEVPGGGLADRREVEHLVRPLLEPTTLGHVVVEVAVGAPWPLRGATADVLASTSRRGRLRLAAGRWDGVTEGDLVTQDGVLVGVVSSAGPWTAEVRRAVPPGQLLVVSPDGEVTPTAGTSDDWPPGWRPEPGWLVVTGHRVDGGLLAGEVATVGPAGLTVALPPIDPAASVRIVER